MMTKHANRCRAEVRAARSDSLAYGSAVLKEPKSYLKANQNAPVLPFDTRDCEHAKTLSVSGENNYVVTFRNTNDLRAFGGSLTTAPWASRIVARHSYSS